LALQRQLDSKPNGHHEQSDVEDGESQGQRVVAGAQPLVAAFPGFGNLQEFFAGADAVALHLYLQAVWRLFCAKAVLFPGERPIGAVRLLLGIGLLGECVPGAQIHCQFCAKKV